MKKIHFIDFKNRFIIIELIITSGYLIPVLKRKGLRLLMPLHSTENKSIISKTLERKPITTSIY
ncbi:MAG: hypothetical protein ACTSRH_16370 [Promethearchaeota archaeon]